VSNLENLFWVQITFNRPSPPLTADGAGGVYKNSVEVEKNGSTAEFCHGK
jgi:hypothetical protein